MITINKQNADVRVNAPSAKAFRWVFFVTAGVMLTDWLLTLIWLPIGVSKTYGFQDASFFTEYYNGTGAPTGWNWLLSFLFTSGVLTGFDAAGHVAEETKNASVTAARGIFWSCFISAVLGTPIIFLYLACSVSSDISCSTWRGLSLIARPVSSPTSMLCSLLTPLNLLSFSIHSRSAKVDNLLWSSSQSSVSGLTP